MLLYVIYLYSCIRCIVLLKRIIYYYYFKSLYWRTNLLQVLNIRLTFKREQQAMLLYESRMLRVCDRTATLVLLALFNISLSGTSIDRHTRNSHVWDSWNGSEVPEIVKLRHHHRKFFVEDKNLKSNLLALNVQSLVEENGRYGSEKPPWPVKREAILEGDLIIGGKWSWWWCVWENFTSYLCCSSTATVRDVYMGLRYKTSHKQLGLLRNYNFP